MIYRDRSLPLFPSEPPRSVGVRRMACGCGCGRWFYVERRPGRPLEYATRDCALRARYLRRAKRGEFQARAV